MKLRFFQVEVFTLLMLCSIASKGEKLAMLKGGFVFIGYHEVARETEAVPSCSSAQRLPGLKGNLKMATPIPHSPAQVTDRLCFCLPSLGSIQ